MMPKHVWHELMILAQVFCTFKMLATLHVNVVSKYTYWHSVFFLLIFSKGLSRFDVVARVMQSHQRFFVESQQDASLG